MKRIRVLLAGVRPILRDIVTDAVTKEDDIEVSWSPASRESLISALERAHADVLIVESQFPDVKVAERVWSRWPRVKVLVIAEGGRTGVLYVLRPDKVVLTDVSAEALTAAIRAEHGCPPS